MLHSSRTLLDNMAYIYQKSMRCFEASSCGRDVLERDRRLLRCSNSLLLERVTENVTDIRKRHLVAKVLTLTEARRDFDYILDAAGVVALTAKSLLRGVARGEYKTGQVINDVGNIVDFLAKAENMIESVDYTRDGQHFSLVHVSEFVNSLGDVLKALDKSNAVKVLRDLAATTNDNGQRTRLDNYASELQRSSVRLLRLLSRRGSTLNDVRGRPSSHELVRRLASERATNHIMIVNV